MPNHSLPAATVDGPSISIRQRSDSTSLRLRTHARALGWTADALEQATQMRVETGLRILGPLDTERCDGIAPDQFLESIAARETDGPVPALARAYRQNLEQEREMERILEELLQEHPAWAWLRDVPGVELSSVGRLLSRLDVTRAPTPSAFWAYCGLATVPSVRHRCAVCGCERTIAQGSQPPANHMAAGGTAECAGRMQPIPNSPVNRVAQPRPGSGDRALYDATAKGICYTIGLELRSAGHRYERYYLQQRDALERSRPEWPSGRRHMTALRKMQKLFLAHLWLVWRQGIGLPITVPSATDAECLGPWAMTNSPRKRWTRREGAVPQLR
ncbi:hypothetical protein BH23GEM8_BH23GEM8_06230 [soil metagenome]